MIDDSDRYLIIIIIMWQVAGEHASTALHMACARGDVAMVEAIVEQMSQLR